MHGVSSLSSNLKSFGDLVSDKMVKRSVVRRPAAEVHDNSCGECRTTYASFEGLRDHMRRKHGVYLERPLHALPRFECSAEEFAFVGISEQFGKITCKHCNGKTFARTSIRRHMSRHGVASETIKTWISWRQGPYAFERICAAYRQYASAHEQGDENVPILPIHV